MAKIADLEHGCPGLPLEVRILRKWVPHYRSSEIWFLAVDSNGDSIGILGENTGQRFVQTQLQLSKCYRIEKYSCSETPRFQRILRNPINLNVGPASQITLIGDDTSIPTSSFHFQSTTSLNSFMNKPDYYPDFIGTYKRTSSGTKTNGDPILYLTLCDNTGYEVVATLWKECAHDREKLDVNQISAATSTPVIALTNVKPGQYGGRTRLSSTDATHVIFNPNVPIHISSSGTSSTSNIVAVSPHVFMTIEELSTKSHSYLLGKTVYTEARIQEFEFEDNWYMSTCDKCKSRIPKQGSTWFCVSDGTIDSPVFYFSLYGLLDDGTGQIRANLTDNFMKTLTGTTAEQLVLKDGYEDRKTIPNILDQYKMHRYKLCLKMSKKSSPAKVNFVVVNMLPNQTPTTSTEIVITPEKQVPLLPAPPSITKSTPPPPPTPTDTTPENTKLQTSTIPKTNKPGASKRLMFDEKEKIESINPTKRERYND